MTDAPRLRAPSGVFPNPLPIALLIACVIAGLGISTPRMSAAAPVVAADAEGWTIRRHEDGIEVATCPVEDSRHDAVRARMTVAASLAEIVALLKDESACAEWAAYCAGANVLAERGETEAWVYTWNDMPWPVRDREVVSHIKWRRDAESGVVHMEGRAVDDPIEETGNRVRLHDARSTWTLEPLAGGEVRVEIVSHVNPSSPVPAALLNSMLVEAPHDTLRRMRALLLSGRYADAQFDFLLPPSDDAH